MVWLFRLALLLLVGCAPPIQYSEAQRSLRLEPVWRVGGFANPESVALSGDGSFLYVTNVNGDGEAHDGNGFISRVSIDGEMLQREFATGLDGPKGIVRLGDDLFVADINSVAVIDAATGSIRHRIEAPGADFLNDIAITPEGLTLVADSGARRIYVVGPDAAEIWLEHELLDGINGLLPEPSRLIATTMAGRLLAIDYGTRAITILSEGLTDADGVASLGHGRFLVSEWPGRLVVVSANDPNDVILDTRAENRLLNDFLLVGDMLYQPHWEPSELTAYRVVR